MLGILSNMHRLLALGLVFATPAALRSAGELPAAEVPLSVDWAGVTMAAGFPVTGGIPFARGTLKNGDHVRLQAAGQDLPLQTETLAVWPDGTVKWLLLDFQALPGQRDFVLRYGAGLRVPLIGPRIQATAAPGVITVDTGPLRFSVRRDGSGLLDGLAFQGREIFSQPARRLNFMDCLHADAPADYPPMQRYVRAAEDDPSRLVVDDVVLEKPGPLHAVVRIEGKYCYRKVGSTITGTAVKGDCPFRIRIHAYAGQSFLRIEHFFYYEGDGDHDFVTALGLKVPLPGGAAKVRYLGERPIVPAGLISGLYQQDADRYVVWQSDGRSLANFAEGTRFEGVLDATGSDMGIAVSVKDFWQNAAKGLRADLKAGELGIYLWPPEACPLDFRRHARQWSVGETGAPDDRTGTTPVAFKRPNYRLASKGVGKTHYVLIHCHAPDVAADDLRKVHQLFAHRPLLWAPPRHYAASLALGPYRHRVPGEHEDLEAILDSGPELWRSSRETFRWYGFWIYGNVCQDYNGFLQNGRWCQEFGRWGWANGDSTGRLAYALMLQAVRKCAREDFEFGESYLYNVHDVCSTHTPAYPHHYGPFVYLKGAAHRHGAWPWSGVYVGARGAHPVGAKIYYFLTGEGHARDILEELTQLALTNPAGGEDDGPQGPNAQILLYQWEATGSAQWRVRLEEELRNSKLLRSADTRWLTLISAAFGIKDALDEFLDLSGDVSLKPLVRSFADRSLPEPGKTGWTWGGYFRVYAAAYNATRDEKYRSAIEESLAMLRKRAGTSLVFQVPKAQWPGPPGGRRPLLDGNIIRDVPFALYSLHLDKE